ncbi:MAG: glycosyltransferase family 4 protein [Candidatus Sungbacteria bacterium]|nr:glycosyltransferase family 4 protein [Candidatus Sungbacteria bacterium]
MKVAIIVRRLNVKGGTQRQALNLASELKKRGHDVTLYTFLFSVRDCYPELLEGLKVVDLGAYPSGGILGDCAENRAARLLAAKIDRATDILNPHDQVAYKVAAYFKKRVRAIPSVWMMNDVPTRLRAEERLKEAKPGTSIPWHKRIVHRALDWYDRKTFIVGQDVILALDERDRGWAESEFGMQAHVIRSGVSYEQFPYRRRISVSTPPRLLMAGIFFPHRRFEDGIEAVELLGGQGIPVELTIAGDTGSDRKYAEKIKKLISERRLEQSVRLAGKVSDSELRRMYRECDIFLFPNHLQSWGLAVFEAMSSGAVVVVSQTAGAAEVLEDRSTALIVPPKSPSAIASAVASLVQDPALFAHMSEGGRAFVESRMSWSRFTDDMEKFFATALKKHE